MGVVVSSRRPLGTGFGLDLRPALPGATCQPFPNLLSPGAGSAQTEVWGGFFGFATIYLAWWAPGLVDTLPSGHPVLLLPQVTRWLQRRWLWGREVALLKQSSSAAASSQPQSQLSTGSCPLSEPSGARAARLLFPLAATEQAVVEGMVSSSPATAAPSEGRLVWMSRGEARQLARHRCASLVPLCQPATPVPAWCLCASLARCAT